MAQRRDFPRRDFILVKTHFPMGVNVLGGIYETLKPDCFVLLD